MYINTRHQVFPVYFVNVCRFVLVFGVYSSPFKIYILLNVCAHMYVSLLINQIAPMKKYDLF